VYMNRVVRGALTKTTLDKTTALELFTMLPMATDHSPLLTSAPSTHNKNLLLKAHDQVGDRNDELMGMNREVCLLVQKSLGACHEVASLATEYTTQFNAHLVRLSKPGPIVILNGVAVNLLDAMLFDVAYTDTHKLHYPPYEGVLDLKFREVVLSDSLTGLRSAGAIHGASDGVLSLRILVNHLLQAAQVAIQREVDLKRMHAQLERVDLPESTVPYDQYLIDESLAQLSALEAERLLFAGQDSLAEKVLSCLTILV
jgi:hypothetical protein